jgi:hypothetical protein
MKEVIINTIKEVIHCDGWKHVIQKSEEDAQMDSKYFNLEIDYYEWNDDFEKWDKKGATQHLSSLILPEFIEALKSFT